MSYKLYYFDARGRAEIIRMLLATSDTQFEDVRFTFEEWPAKYKAASPSGQAPYLVDPVSGRTLVQSFAIARLLAKRFGLMSDDPIEYYKIERMLAQISDMVEPAIPIMFGDTDEEKATAKKTFLEGKAPNLLANLVKYLTESSDSKFVAGKSLTLGDIALIDATDFLSLLCSEVAELLAKHPEIAAHRKHALESNKKLADYLANRKAAQF